MKMVHKNENMKLLLIDDENNIRDGLGGVA